MGNATLRDWAKVDIFAGSRSTVFSLIAKNIVSNRVVI